MEGQREGEKGKKTGRDRRKERTRKTEREQETQMTMFLFSGFSQTIIRKQFRNKGETVLELTQSNNQTITRSLIF